MRMNPSRFGENEIVPPQELTLHYLLGAGFVSGSPKLYQSDPERMTWFSELSFLVCTVKITTLYEVVLRLPGDDVGFDKGEASARYGTPCAWSCSKCFAFIDWCSVLILGVGTLRSSR